jgi:hypothetical protein
MTGGARRGGERNFGGGGGVAAGPVWAQMGVRRGGEVGHGQAGPRCGEGKGEGGAAGPAGRLGRARGGGGAGPKWEERGKERRERFPFSKIYFSLDEWIHIFKQSKRMHGSVWCIKQNRVF